jgi:hypothetical protein
VCSADGAAVAELLTCAGDEDTDSASADDAAAAVVAWFTALDDAGRTPSRMAAAPGASAALAALDVTLRQRLRAGSRLACTLAAALLAEVPHAAAREAPVARARRAADVARGSVAAPQLGLAAAAELERATRDARAVAAALIAPAEGLWTTAKVDRIGTGQPSSSIAIASSLGEFNSHCNPGTSNATRSDSGSLRRPWPKRLTVATSISIAEQIFCTAYRFRAHTVGIRRSMTLSSTIVFVKLRGIDLVKSLLVR